MKFMNEFNSVQFFRTYYSIGTSYFNHRHGCQRCNAIGVFHKATHRTCFADFNGDKRTDDSFRRRWDKEHHKETSCFEEMVYPDGTPMIDMVYQFPISDPLHLLDEGVMKKLIDIWRKGTNSKTNKKWAKEVVAKLNEQIVDWNRELSSDFHRKMRSLQYVKYWKATEFRLVLLYVGIVAFKDVLTEAEYCNFLRLCLGVRFCSCETYVKVDNYKNVAKNLLRGFCTNFVSLYGSTEVVSNIHNVNHIIDDVNYFGSLTTISTYPFENYLRELKIRVHPSNSSIEQVSRRMAEISLDENSNCIDLEMREYEKSIWSPMLKYETEKNQFEFIQITPNVFLQIRKTGDKWFLTKNGEVVAMQYATIENSSYVICGTPIKEKLDFFTSPFSSNKAHIYKSDGIFMKEQMFYVKDIKAKMLCLTYNNQNVFIPILHSIDECLEYCKHD